MREDKKLSAMNATRNILFWYEVANAVIIIVRMPIPVRVFLLWQTFICISIWYHGSIKLQNRGLWEKNRPSFTTPFIQQAGLFLKDLAREN